MDRAPAVQQQHSHDAVKPSLESSGDEEVDQQQGAPRSGQRHGISQAAHSASHGARGRAGGEHGQQYSDDDDSSEAVASRHWQPEKTTDGGSSLDVEVDDAEWDEDEDRDNAVLQRAARRADRRRR